jgi:hypothetical protein
MGGGITFTMVDLVGMWIVPKIINNIKL